MAAFSSLKFNPIPNPYQFGGLNVHIAEPYMVEVDLTWKERLFSWPFRPFQKTRWEQRETVNDFEVIRYNDTYVMNQKTYNALRAGMKAGATNHGTCN